MRIFLHGRYRLNLPIVLIALWVMTAVGFHTSSYCKIRSYANGNCIRKSDRSLNMNVFGDAVRFFTNLNKEASAKHILVKGPNATEKLLKIKEEIESAADISVAFSEIASKVSECPSAKRGGNLGTFKPGMLVSELDKICFEKELGVVHGPVSSQFGHHLVLVTRRYEGEQNSK